MGARILIAEDTVEISNFLDEHFTEMGHTVKVVGNGAELLPSALKTRPHVIITDIQMPGAYGSAAYLSLQKNAKTKAIPVIFISGHPVESFIPNTPTTRYVQKPLDIDKLTRFVVELLPLGGYKAP